MGRTILGIDAGGSSTEALLVDETGRVLGRGAGGPSNFRGVGLGRALQELSRTALKALEAAGITGALPSVACLGLAGVNREEDRRSVGEAIEALALGEEVVLENDLAVTLAGAIPEGWGVAVHSGTGSIVYGRDRAGRVVRADGWGHLLGDEASGYALGRECLRAVMRGYDGRGPATGLMALLLSHLRLDSPTDLIPVTYEIFRTPDQVAGLAPLVFRAAQEGDDVAEEVLGRAEVALLEAFRAVVDGLGWRDQPFPAVLTGGVLRANQEFRRGLAAKMRKIARVCDIVESRLSPAAGAVLLAARRLGLDPDETFLARLGAG